LKNLDTLRTDNLDKSKLISTLSEEKTLFGCKEQAYKFKIESLETKVLNLELELNVAFDENERMKTKLEENIKIISVFKKSIMNVMEEKQNETIENKSFIKILEDALLKADLDSNIILQENKKFKQVSENQSLQDDKEKIINRLNSQIQESELARKNLQEQLLNSEKKIDLLIKNQRNREENTVILLSLFILLDS